MSIKVNLKIQKKKWGIYLIMKMNESCNFFRNTSNKIAVRIFRSGDFFLPL